MSLSNLYNTLGQTVYPAVLAQTMPDTLTVKRETVTKDSGGGTIKGTPASYVTGVPCAVEPIEKEKTRRDIQGDRQTPMARYTVTMPTHHSGSRINLNPSTDRLVIAARGNEPQRTLRMMGTPRNFSGVVFQADCYEES